MLLWITGRIAHTYGLHFRMVKETVEYVIIMTKRDYLLLVDEEVVKLLTWIQSMGVGMEQLCMKLDMLLVLALTEKNMSE